MIDLRHISFDRSKLALRYRNESINVAFDFDIIFMVLEIDREGMQLTKIGI